MNNPKNYLFNVDTFYPYQSRPMTGKELLDAILSVEDKVCAYYDAEIQRREPVDRSGFFIFHSQKELEGWRHYQSRHMAVCFRELRKLADAIA